MTVSSSHESTAWKRKSWTLGDVGEFKAVQSSKEASKHLGQVVSNRVRRNSAQDDDQGASPIRHFDPFPVQRKRAKATAGFTTQGSQDLYRDASYTHGGKDFRSGTFFCRPLPGFEALWKRML
jgi:hypothetical protein